MEFTGERFVPSEQGRIRLEHYHRYAMVRDLVRGKRVLDVACGEGYGTNLLAEIASSATGVDISDEAVRHASATYPKANLLFQQGSAISLNFPEQSFDVVVSFETLEHLAEQEQMIAEIRRVLTVEGILVISTPNRPIYSEESGEHNSFHVKELDFAEFDELLKTTFERTEYFGQRLLISSVIQGIESQPDTGALWSDDGTALACHAPKLVDPIYFVAVCGSSKAILPKIGTSSLYPDTLDLVKHYVNFAKWAAEQDKVIAGCNWQIDQLRQNIAERGKRVSELEAYLTEQQKESSRLAVLLGTRDVEVTNLKIAVPEQRTALEVASGSLAERQEQIANLGGVIAQLKEDIERLSAAAIARETRIVDCEKEIELLQIAEVERLSEIRHLSDIVTKRETRIAELSLMLNEHETKILEMLTSYAWRMTLPLRRTAEAGSRLADKFTSTFFRNRSDRKSPKESVDAIKLRLLATLAGKPDEIEIPSSDNPLVSVIIPIYGKVDYTLRCLASIALNPPAAAFEVVIVDDCSPDNSLQLLSRVRGLRLIRNHENSGFIISCNSGASEAKGQYLHFLNNDTEVTAGWLDELLRIFEEVPHAGLVGSKLVYPDGYLQEAGGIIWQDGSAWNWGHRQDPAHYAYNYVRDTDYISGASIMVPTDLFKRLGMFNTLYTPAYYEDTDLAMAVRQAGMRVVYQPYSRVLHFEGVSSGTDVTQGTKRFQEINRVKFMDRWANELSDLTPNAFKPFLSCDRKRNRHILVVDACTPTPDQDSGSLDMINLIKIMIEQNWRVHFVPFSNFIHFGQYTDTLQRLGVECVYAPYHQSLESYLNERGDMFDVCLLARTDVASRVLPTVKKFCPSARTIFYTVDLHFLREKREAELQNDPEKLKKAKKTEHTELGLMDKVDNTVVLSEVERDLLLGLGKTNLTVIPLIREVGVPVTTCITERNGAVFVGGFQHLPNVDAVEWLTESIWPEVRKILEKRSLPLIPLYIVGSNMPKQFAELNSEDIIPVGFVSDLTEIFERVRISVAPLRYGAGLKGKVASSLLYGIPVVGTTMAYEGMPGEGLEQVRFEGNDPVEIAQLVVDLHHSETELEMARNNCRSYAIRHFGRSSVERRVKDLLSVDSVSPDDLRSPTHRVSSN